MTVRYLARRGTGRNELYVRQWQGACGIWVCAKIFLLFPSVASPVRYLGTGGSLGRDLGCDGWLSCIRTNSWPFWTLVYKKSSFSVSFRWNSPKSVCEQNRIHGAFMVGKVNEDGLCWIVTDSCPSTAGLETLCFLCRDPGCLLHRLRSKWAIR